jgi:Na+-translocating ferredoxin:NAD+ oxidoreductase RnfA subunit
VCPFLGVSSKISTSVGMTGAVIFVMTIATVVTYLINTFLPDSPPCVPRTVWKCPLMAQQT